MVKKKWPVSNNQSPVGQQPSTQRGTSIVDLVRSMEQKYIISTKMVDFYKNIFLIFSPL